MTDTNSRHYPARPILAVGALIFDGDRILLIERGREPLKGQWALPGGVETGEPLEAAIIREVFEETGLHVAPKQVALIFQRILHDSHGMAEYHYVIVDFFCEIESGTLCAGDDCSGVRWMPLDKLDQVQLTEGTLDAVRHAVEHGPRLTVLRA